MNYILNVICKNNMEKSILNNSIDSLNNSSKSIDSNDSILYKNLKPIYYDESFELLETDYFNFNYFPNATNLIKKYIVYRDYIPNDDKYNKTNQNQDIDKDDSIICILNPKQNYCFIHGKNYEICRESHPDGINCYGHSSYDTNCEMCCGYNNVLEVCKMRCVKHINNLDIENLSENCFVCRAREIMYMLGYLIPKGKIRFYNPTENKYTFCYAFSPKKFLEKLEIIMMNSAK